MQAAWFQGDQPLAHPLERLIAEANLTVDAASVAVVAQVSADPGTDLTLLKQLARSVTQALPPEESVPQVWELRADSQREYRFVVYEGLSQEGTYWTVSAYQLLPSGLVYVALRTEGRNLPQDVRTGLQRLRQHLQAGIHTPILHVDTRIAVSGRTRWPEARLENFARQLLQAIGRSDAVHVREDNEGLRVTAYTPYLTSTSPFGTNVEFHIIPEGSSMRLTIGTPYLGAVEHALVSDRPFTYTTVAWRQTMDKEVR